MAEYRFYTRGRGLAQAIADGWYCDSYFSGLFDECPEQILTDDQRLRLNDFLLHVPSLHARRTKKQREQGAQLLALIAPLTENTLLPEARELLLGRIAGRTIRRAHRPAKQIPTRLDDTPLLAKWIKQSVEACIREGRALTVPRWGIVEEDPSWRRLPLSERSLQIARGALVSRELRLPSDATLRNRMSKIPDLRHLIVKAREEEQG